MIPAYKYGLIILAAGSSSRLGRPKQLLKYNNQTLLQHIVQEAVATVGEHLVVVLGAYQGLLQPELSALNIPTVDNERWQEGLAGSVSTGLTSLLGVFPDLDAVILALCDQPYISSALFSALIEMHQRTRKGIVASCYDGTCGVPVLFHKKYFRELIELVGHDGAKQVLNRHPGDVENIPFPKGNIDIDTAGDYADLCAAVIVGN